MITFTVPETTWLDRYWIDRDDSSGKRPAVLGPYRTLAEAQAEAAELNRENEAALLAHRMERA